MSGEGPQLLLPRAVARLADHRLEFNYFSKVGGDTGMEG